MPIANKDIFVSSEATQTSLYSTLLAANWPLFTVCRFPAFRRYVTKGTHTEQEILGPWRHENNDLNLHRTDINISTCRFTRLQKTAQEKPYTTPKLNVTYQTTQLPRNSSLLQERVLSK